MTWQELQTIAPEICAALDRRLDCLALEMVRGLDGWEAYSRAKSEVTGLVGYFADDCADQRLSTTDAYEAAIGHVTKVLQV